MVLKVIRDVPASQQSEVIEALAINRPYLTYIFSQDLILNCMLRLFEYSVFVLHGKLTAALFKRWKAIYGTVSFLFHLYLYLNL